MDMANWKRQTGGLGLVAAILMTGAIARGQDDVQNDPGPLRLELRLGQDGQHAHWIGVSARPLREVLRRQLKLKDGLIITQVAPNSPAGKAGLKRHDIILQFGDVKPSSPRSLLDVVRNSSGQQVDVKLLRDGEELSVQITPEERPASGLEQALQDAQAQVEAAIGKLRDWQPSGEGAVLFRRFGPGVMTPSGISKDVPFPKDLSVTITKSGEELAQIAVKRGDESWQVTDRELDKLPEDVRRHVQRLLGHWPLFEFKFQPFPQDDVRRPHPPEGPRPRFRRGPDGSPGPQPPRGPAPRRARGRQDRMENIQRRIERRLEDVARQLKKLRGELGELRGEQPQADATPDIDIEIPKSEPPKADDESQ